MTLRFVLAMVALAALARKLKADQYGENISFLWKIIFLVVAGFNLLYATVFEGPWHVEAGQKAPLRVRLAGASAIIAWGGVMYFGRMLPFLGNAF